MISHGHISLGHAVSIRMLVLLVLMLVLVLLLLLLGDPPSVGVGEVLLRRVYLMRLKHLVWEAAEKFDRGDV